ncbi:MAG: riboflavin synthase [Corynebacterium glucuronolyticum]|nr:riboflavin synthase [Corynebacterium glucuronolyticum]MDD7585761.1 riboflavin synthase [Mycobacteriaceae bacterium]MDY5834929.1 riboflavin synthase [Corynebacterium glucuronolyticum]
MFTGLVEEVGQIAGLEAADDSVILTIGAERVLDGVQLGDSISVNGVCLTVTEFTTDTFHADVMKESLDRSNLGELSVGSPVNLERAVELGSRLGGHLVQGHVDGVAMLVSRTSGSHWEVFRFTLPESLSRYVVEKGSICVNGTSLTVSGLGEGEETTPEASAWFEVSLIPTTLRDTNLGALEVGASVNIEVDVIAKYVEKMLAPEEFHPGGTD